MKRRSKVSGERGEPTAPHAHEEAAVMLALTAVVILFRYFPPPTCPTIEGVLVIAGECP